MRCAITQRGFGTGTFGARINALAETISSRRPHRDPVTGETSYVFSCFNQDQPLDNVDFGCLRERLGQNSLQEKLTKMWIDRGLRLLGLREELVAQA